MTPRESFLSGGWWFWYAAFIHPFGIVALVICSVLLMDWWDARQKRKAQERRRARRATSPRRRYVSRRARSAVAPSSNADAASYWR